MPKLIRQILTTEPAAPGFLTAKCVVVPNPRKTSVEDVVVCGAGAFWLDKTEPIITYVVVRIGADAPQELVDFGRLAKVLKRG